MSEPELSKPEFREGIAWDDVVDVICVGTAPGVLAYAICCVEADLDVLVVDCPVEPVAGIAELMSAMTEDLDSPPDECAVSDAVPVCRVRHRTVGEAEPNSGRREPLEAFVGEHLRQWSSLCLASPTGVLFTQVPDVLTPMSTDDGTISAAVLGAYRTPLDQWLREQVVLAEDRLADLVFDGGRIVGVRLVDGSLIGATGGLALPVGPTLTDWPAGGVDARVALVSRPAGRFARVELIVGAAPVEGPENAAP